MHDKIKMSEVTIIKPKRGFIPIDFKELWQYKELLITLALRDIKVRYKQTVIGGLWAILQPLLTMVIFTFFFGNILKISSEGFPYAIFSYAGLLLWTYFSSSLSSASDSLVANSSLLSKIYFPRIMLPLYSTLSGLLDYAVASIILFGLMFYYKIAFTLYLPLILVVLFFTWMLASGMGFWLSAFNVKYRDVRHALPFFIQMLIFITPVIYPISVAGKFKWLLMLNPMTGFIEAHRAIILGKALNVEMMLVSIVLTIVIFITGAIYFKSVERSFADVI